MAGCGCGKNAKPTGFGTSIQDAQRKGGKEIQADDKRKRASFELKSGGRTMTFGSDLERRAHQSRHGGTIV